MLRSGCIAAHLLAAMVLVPPVSACSAATTSSSARPAYVATLDGSPIEVEEILREARFLSADERKFRERIGMPAEQSVRDWTKRIALRRIVTRLVEAESARAETARQAHAAARAWAIERLERVCYGFERTPPAASEIAAALATSRPPSPPRVRISQIFLAATSDEAAAVAAARLAEIRPAIDGDLDRFREQAALHTESATARRDGALGWIQRGWIDPAAEEELFRAAPGTIVGPVRTRAGLHLFFVEDRDPGGGALPPAAVAREMRRRVETMRAGCRADRLQAIRAGGEPDLDPSGDRLDEDERLFAEALASGRFDPDERARLTDLELDVRVGRAISSAVDAALLATNEPAATIDAELRRRYAERAEPFRTLSRHRFTLLSVAIDRAAPLALLDRLNAIAAELRAGRIGWEEARAAIDSPSADASLERLPELDSIEVAGRIGPPLFERLRILPPGAVSAAIQDGDRLYLGAVEGFVPSRPKSFDEARAALASERERERRRELAERIASDWLEAHAFRWTDGSAEIIAELAAAQSRQDGAAE